MRFLALLLLPLLLVACHTPPGPPTVLSFTRYQPINLDVSNIEVVEEYKSPEHAPYVEHLMPYSPTDAVHIWVKDRFRALGSDKTLQVIIKDASVKSVPLESKGIKSLLPVDLSTRYEGKLTVELRVYSSTSAISLASIEVHATRTSTFSDSLSKAQRDENFRRMIFDLMEAFNAEMEKNLFQYFNKYIHFSLNP